MAQDPFSGFDTLPYSLHPYQYAYSNPILYTDPSGECPWCAIPLLIEAGKAILIGIGGYIVAHETKAAIERCGYEHCFDGLVPTSGFSTSTIPPQTTSAPHGDPTPRQDAVPPPISSAQPPTIQHTGHPAPYCPPDPLIFVQGSILSEQLPPFALDNDKSITASVLTIHINERHFLTKIRSKTPTKDRNTIILPQYEQLVKNDLAQIAQGLGLKQGNIIYINGRTYGKESQTTYYPIDDGKFEGFVELGRNEYTILKIFIHHGGNKDLALKEIRERQKNQTKQPITQEQIDVAEYYFGLLSQYRGVR